MYYLSLSAILIEIMPDGYFRDIETMNSLLRVMNVIRKLN